MCLLVYRRYNFVNLGSYWSTYETTQDDRRGGRYVIFAFIFLSISFTRAFFFLLIARGKGSGPFINLKLLHFLPQAEDNDDDVTEELLIHQCTSKYYVTWMMSICGFKGILLIFGVFLAWETRNVTYPSLNDSKNIGLAVYNVFMFSCLAIVTEFVVTYPPLQILVVRCIVFVGTTSTISLLFVPKVRVWLIFSQSYSQFALS